MIAATFARLRRNDELGLMPFLTAGFPSRSGWLECLDRIVEGGADLVEVGFPFSDPVADGPTIQDASCRALRQGIRLGDVLDDLAARRLSVPVSLMSYLNPLLALGPSALFERLQNAGVAGLIVPDLPHDESAEWAALSRGHGVSLIPLVAPTSPRERVRSIVERADGFVYYVSVTGTTGVRKALSDDLLPALDELRRSTELPVAVGFGVSEAEQIRGLRGHCDGVVVGSRIVDAIRTGEDLIALIRHLKQATRGGEPC